MAMARRKRARAMEIRESKKHKCEKQNLQVEVEERQAEEPKKVNPFLRSWAWKREHRYCHGFPSSRISLVAGLQHKVNLLPRLGKGAPSESKKMLGLLVLFQKVLFIHSDIHNLHNVAMSVESHNVL